MKIKRKSVVKLFVFKAIVLLTLTPLMISCDKDEDVDQTTPPEIYDLFAGDHDHTTNVIIKRPGAEIIVDFSARSQNDGRLEAYHIEIHDHPESGNPADEYLIIDDLFDNDPTFKGTRNASVHKHIPIPDDAPLGEYHVEIVVFDEFGNTTDADTHIYLIEDDK